MAWLTSALYLSTDQVWRRQLQSQSHLTNPPDRAHDPWPKGTTLSCTKGERVIQFPCSFNPGPLKNRRLLMQNVSCPRGTHLRFSHWAQDCNWCVYRAIRLCQGSTITSIFINTPMSSVFPLKLYKQHTKTSQMWWSLWGTCFYPGGRTWITIWWTDFSQGQVVSQSVVDPPSEPRISWLCLLLQQLGHIHPNLSVLQHILKCLAIPFICCYFSCCPLRYCYIWFCFFCIHYKGLLYTEEKTMGSSKLKFWGPK